MIIQNKQFAYSSCTFGIHSVKNQLILMHLAVKMYARQGN